MVDNGEEMRVGHGMGCLSVQKIKHAFQATVVH